jgi:hypothetical protein
MITALMELVSMMLLSVMIAISVLLTVVNLYLDVLALPEIVMIMMLVQWTTATMLPDV